MPEIPPLQPEPGDPDDRFTTLAIRYLDGVSGEAELDSLRRALCDSDACCRRFVELSIQARSLGEPLLQRLGRRDFAVAPRRNLGPRPGATRLLLLRFGAAAAIVLIAVELISMALQSSRRHATATADEPVAMVADVQDAVWAPGQNPLSPGEQLRGGFITLASGRLVIGFNSGASVVIHGPAEFGVNSAMRGFLRRGGLRATVPHSAKGFTIGAPGLAVIDLGTEFDMEARPGGARVRVLRGKVRVVPDGDAAAGREFTSGDAVSVTRGRIVAVQAVTVTPMLVIDQDRNPDGSTGASNGPIISVGIIGAPGSRHPTAAVYVYELPTLPGGSIVGADFRVSLVGQSPDADTKATYNLSLFGLGQSSTDTTYSDGYDATGTLIAPSAFVAADLHGRLPKTVTITDAGLLTLIQSFYVGNTPTVRYLVLRLNADVNLSTRHTVTRSGYGLGASENANASLRPLLTFQVVPPLDERSERRRGLNTGPNPLTKGDRKNGTP